MATALLAAAGFTACSSDKVSFNTLEDARGTARANAEWNAKAWRAQLYPEYDLISRGDSTQSPDCPQGDGWATLDLISPDKISSKTISIKCSTVSSNVGCLEQKDFKTKSYANEDGQCQTVEKVPFPLPKVAK